MEEIAEGLRGPSVSRQILYSRNVQRLGFMLPWLGMLCSLGLLAWQALLAPSPAWETLALIYLGLLVLNTWFIFGLLVFGSLRRPRHGSYGGEEIAVIVPCFNEEPEILKIALTSILEAKGRKRLLLVDDGSTNGIRGFLEEWSADHGATLHCLDENRGKREAIRYAVERLPSSTDFVVMVDSDTVVHPDALIRVVEPLQNPKIGASTGEVQVRNEKSNPLTRSIAAYYWSALNIYKYAQSAIGAVVCCSGCLSAYKPTILRRVMDDFVSQEFLGSPCMLADDRHLTNLTLREGYDVVYVRKAIAYTETPDRLRPFLEQQTRWKRGFISESVYTLSHSWRTKPVLFAQILFWDYTEPYATLGLRIAVMILCVLDPSFLLVLVPAWLIVNFLRNIFLIMESPRHVPGLVAYMFLYEFVVYWVNIWALFTVNRSGWLAREGAVDRPQFSSAVV